MHLVVVDAHSKFPEVVVLPNQTAETTIVALREIFARYGVPINLVSDNGSNFTSTEFTKFLSENGIRHIRSAPFHPATNAQAERFVQTFKDAMRAARNDEGTYEQKLQRFLLQYRKAPHSTTGESPAQLFFKRSIRTRLDLLKPDTQTLVSNRQVPVQFESADREFVIGSKVLVRDYRGNDKWQVGCVESRIGQLNYKVRVGHMIWTRHIDQIRACGTSVNVSKELPLIEKVIPNTSNGLITEPSKSPLKEPLASVVSQSNEIVKDKEVLPEKVELRKSTRVKKPVDRLNL